LQQMACSFDSCPCIFSRAGWRNGEAGNFKRTKTTALFWWYEDSRVLAFGSARGRESSAELICVSRGLIFRLQLHSHGGVLSDPPQSERTHSDFKFGA
jgi:hypothetical protein